MLNKLAQEITAWRVNKGFITSKDNMLEKLTLVVTECSEAAEDVRHGDWEHFGEEIADTMIHLLDICGTLQINIEFEIEKKMRRNMERPYLHGTTSRA